ncbi:MAG: tetratricopeptide repeat protein, partial [Burkholderiales bacterium]|nr:tetratricopeptide repeat protein [Burkholderiales bacterium]
MAGKPAVGQAFQWYREGEFARALEAARRLLEADPSDVNALHVAGLATARLGDSAGGLALVERALATAPASVPLWLSRGKVLLEAGREDEAREAFAKAAALDPASYNAHLELGLLDAKRSRARDAARSLLRAWRSR